jgi:hypothetical protein
VDVAGLWFYQWIGTGAAAGRTNELPFYVLPTAFTTV